MRLTITTLARAGARAGRPLLAVAGLLLAASCGEDGTGPAAGSAPSAPVTAADSGTAGTPDSSTSGIPDSSTAGMPDSSTTGTSDTSGAGGDATMAPGIAFGTYGMDASLLNSVHTGTLRDGGIDQTNVLALLSAVKAKGGRLVLKMCAGRDSFVQNSDGTFSLSKWKALVDRFRQVNLDPYIKDGTLVGHFLIDEPQRAAKWGGKPLTQANVEAMAQYSKQIWPGLTTFVRAQPTWLKQSPITYRYLDAGWAQYAAGKGSASTWVAAEIAAAKSKGLGLAVGLNVLGGGNGSSKQHIWKDTWSMTATEVRSYGSAMLADSYGCAFYMWMYDGSYYGRTDIKSAFADLSQKAQAHPRTSCRQ